jgi:hypothetical protein
MINLDQVRTLEWKVKQAVQLIVHLRRENDTLRGRLSDTEVRLQELETLLEAIKASQNEMESGIRSALEDLDNLEGGESAPAPAAGPVDPVAYPPIEAAEEPVEAAAEEPVEAAAEEFVADDPSALFERSPTFHEEAPETSPDLTFEEEFAALAAQEAEVLSSTVPESVELEVEAEMEAEAPEAEAPPPEEKRPEQPGLGIF